MASEVHFTAPGLQGFYEVPLGAVTRRVLRGRLRQVWPELVGREVLGLGHAGPYLRLWRRGAARLVSATPASLAAGHGMAPWPPDGRCAATLAEEDRLPFADMSFDNILLVHGLEAAENARGLLREAWRVLRPEGRLLAVVPNRRSVWAHLERTPFGHGQPYSPGQLARLLQRAMFTVERREAALFIPPFHARPLLRGARLWEAAGQTLAPQFGGVTLIEARKVVAGMIPAAPVPFRRPVRVPQAGWARADAAGPQAARSLNMAGGSGAAELSAARTHPGSLVSRNDSMNRTTLAAAAALLAMGGSALAQTTMAPTTAPAGQVPVVQVPAAPGTATQVAPTVVVPNAVVQGTVVPGTVGTPAPVPGQAVQGSVLPGTVVTPNPVVPGQPVQGTVVPGTLLQPGQPVPPGMVQTGTVMVQPAPRGNTRVGQLQCDVSGGVGFIFGSSRDLTCEFKPSNGPVERYHGEIRRFGVDIGVTGRGTMLWTVVNTGSDVAPGSLAGTYGGASSNVSAGLGLGSAVLIGGSNDQVALQPLSIESNTGVNVAAGIAELNLRQGG